MFFERHYAKKRLKTQAKMKKGQKISTMMKKKFQSKKINKIRRSKTN
jgi:hypothetical protein